MKANCSYLFFAMFLLSISSFNAFSKSSLSGKLIQSNGLPLLYTEIELVSTEPNAAQNEKRLLAISNTGGKFTFSSIPNGKYSLSINFEEKPTDYSPYSTFFYPGTEKRSNAQIFEVTDSASFSPVIFRLPPKLIERRISGQVHWSNGDPVADAFIYINDAEFDKTFGLTNLQTDKNGNFTIRAFENRNYQVGAVLFERLGTTLIDAVGPIVASARSNIFLLDAKTGKINLTLEATDEMKRARLKNVGILTDFFTGCDRIALKTISGE